MTLSPVFRSHEAVQCLQSEGFLDRLSPAVHGQSEAIAVVRRDLPNVLDATYLAPGFAESPAPGLEFVQEYFFLILFRAVLESIGVGPRDLQFCSQINFCIKGTITASDNLFDDQDKLLLPLLDLPGARFRSILQLLTFERLTHRVLARAIEAQCLPAAAAGRVSRDLLSRMTAIGALEGSEEAGVRDVPPPDRMIETVHRIRGGALFELAFVAPRLLTDSPPVAVLDRAQQAISRMGTAFQIVDDLTDFEFDLTHGRQNIVVSFIVHRGSESERRELQTIATDGLPAGDVVQEHFLASAREVIQCGEREMNEALLGLQSLGFWLPPQLGDQLLRAIVGAEGVDRMRFL